MELYLENGSVAEGEPLEDVARGDRARLFWLGQGRRICLKPGVLDGESVCCGAGCPTSWYVLVLRIVPR